MMKMFEKVLVIAGSMAAVLFLAASVSMAATAITVPVPDGIDVEKACDELESKYGLDPGTEAKECYRIMIAEVLRVYYVQAVQREAVSEANEKVQDKLKEFDSKVALPKVPPKQEGN